MRELLLGILDFRKKILPDLRTMMKQLSVKQNPNSLFIACSDSRVVPNLFASTNPGELFVVRNVGNLIPKCSHSSHKHSHGVPEEIDSSGAAIEYSILQLGVRNVIVCGHSNCGAMHAILNKDQKKFDKTLPYVSGWLKNGKSSLEKLNQLHKNEKEVAQQRLRYSLVGETEIQAKIDPSLPLHDQLSQINVLQQVEHLTSYKPIQEKVAAKELLLHGWWFDIANGDVYSFNDRKNKFVLIDEEKAEVLLKKIEDVEKLIKSKDTKPSTDVPPWVIGLKK